MGINNFLTILPSVKLDQASNGPCFRFPNCPKFSNSLHIFVQAALISSLAVAFFTSSFIVAGLCGLFTLISSITVLRHLGNGIEESDSDLLHPHYPLCIVGTWKDNIANLLSMAIQAAMIAGGIFALLSGQLIFASILLSCAVGSSVWLIHRLNVGDGVY